MPSLVLSSDLFRNMFGTEAMRTIFSDRALVQHYLDIEAALARVQAELGLIPAEAGTAITQAARIENVDFDRMAAKTEIVGYPIIALVEQLSEWCPDGLGQYCHWGATTQDIMDTADALQVRDGLDLIQNDIDSIAEVLAGLAEAHKHTAMAGRTHLQHALPVTFGQRAAGWLSAIDRHNQRIEDLKPRVLVGEFAGAAGTLASLGKDGLRVQDALMDALRIGKPTFTWHTARDGFAEATGALALLTGTLGKIGYDVMLLMQSEVGEVFEPFVSGRGASSTMPQKRNPISSELLLAAAKITRQHHGTMLDAIVQDHERATGPWHAEWHAMPECFIVTAGALYHANSMLSDLEVRPDAMARNLDVTGGLIVAEAVMMGLAPHIGRQRAHDLVYDCCRQCLEGEQNFVETLMSAPEIADALTRDAVEAFVDPSNYLGVAPEMVERFLSNRAG